MTSPDASQCWCARRQIRRGLHRPFISPMPPLSSPPPPPCPSSSCPSRAPPAHNGLGTNRAVFSRQEGSRADAVRNRVKLWWVARGVDGVLAAAEGCRIPACYFGLPLNVVSSVGIILIAKVLFRMGFIYPLSLVGLNFLATASVQCCTPRRAKTQPSQSFPARHLPQ